MNESFTTKFLSKWFHQMKILSHNSSTHLFKNKYEKNTIDQKNYTN